MLFLYLIISMILRWFCLVFYVVVSIEVITNKMIVFIDRFVLVNLCLEINQGIMTCHSIIYILYVLRGISGSANAPEGFKSLYGLKQDLNMIVVFILSLLMVHLHTCCYIMKEIT
ncbi:hypothetical protein ACJX0J_011621, partial [Zea mays]